MNTTSLKTGIAALAIGAGLIVPLAPARAGDMMMGGGGMGGSGFGGAGVAALGAGVALGFIGTLLASHHADAENETTGRRVDCYQFGACHIHVVTGGGEASDVHVWQEPPRRPGNPAKPEKVVAHSPKGTNASSYDPATGLTTTSVSNGDGTHTITVR
jgi:hypothetical protein